MRSHQRAKITEVQKIIRDCYMLSVAKLNQLEIGKEK